MEPTETATVSIRDHVRLQQSGFAERAEPLLQCGNAQRKASADPSIPVVIQPTSSNSISWDGRNSVKPNHIFSLQREICQTLHETEGNTCSTPEEMSWMLHCGFEPHDLLDGGSRIATNRSSSCRTRFTMQSE